MSSLSQSEGLSCLAAIMARYIFFCRGFSPRDGGWVRFGGTFNDEETGWKCIILIWPMIVDHGDYVTVDVKKTITF